MNDFLSGLDSWFYIGMTGDDLIRQAAIEIPEEDLRDIVCRIVEAADPEKIVLFGSAARGTMGPHSDLDLLVIKDGEYSNIGVSQDLYGAMRGVTYSLDIVVVTPAQVERYKDSYCLVLYPALREGRVIYDQALQPGRPAAERGVDAEAASRENLRVAYRRFVSEKEPDRKDEADRDLIRAIFGRDAIAEDPVL